MGPSLAVKIETLEEVKLELLGRAIRGLDVTKELKHVEAKLNNYGKMRRHKKKFQKRFK